MHFKLAKARCVSLTLQVFVTIVVGCSVFSASAAQWRLAPFLELSETYTDNIALQPAGEKVAEYVTQVNPGFSLSGKGRRINLLLNYRLQNLFYSEARNRNSSNHRLLASMDAELLREFLFLDANASLLQRIVNPDGDIGQGNIAFSSNRQNIATTTLSPYLKKKLGSWSQAEVRYTRSRIRSLDGLSRGSVSDAISGQLVDLKRAGRWFWRVDFSSRYVEYTARLRPDEQWKNISFSLDHRFSRKLSFNGVVGYEDNKYLRGSGVTTPKGGYWNIGINWRPIPRTNLVVGRGERYFGPVWNFNLAHRARRSTITGDYIYELSSRRQYLLDVPQFDPYGNPILDPDTSEQIISRDPVDEVFVRQRASLGVDYRTLKSTTALNIYTEYRDYQLSGREEEISGGALSWFWKFNRRDSLTIVLNSRRTDVVGEYLDRLLVSRTSFERKLGRHVVAALDARQTKRQRDSGNNYTENLLTVRLTMSW